MASVSCIDEEDQELLLGGPGDYILGRGELMKISDKRVSRNHAVLCLKEDGTVTICPKHTNPFFYKSTKEDSFKQLPRNDQHTVENNSKISFLLNELIYTIKVTQSDSKTSPMQEETPTKEATPTLKTPSLGTSATNILEPSVTHSLSTSSNNTGKKRRLPSWLTDTPATDISVKKAKAKKAPSNVTSKASPSPSSTSLDTGHMITVNSDKCDKLVDNSKESEDNRTTIAINKGDREKRLPQCPYGKKCYRKNPAHFNEYSHDSEENDDVDSDEDIPECPYGTSCYRKNPAHHREFKHTGPPTGTKRPTRVAKRNSRKKAKKSVLAGDSDDESEPNTYDYNDSFINDEGMSESSGSSSYKSDSEDEDWHLPSAAGDGEGRDDEENVAELVSEADSFMSNKKMHRTTV